MKIYVCVAAILVLTSEPNTVCSQSEVNNPTELLNTAHHRTRRFISVEDAVSVVSTVLEIWEAVDKRLGDSNINLTNVTVDLPSFLNRKHSILNERILEVSRQIDRLDEKLSRSVDTTINSILLAVPKIVKTELRLNDLRNVVNQINQQDGNMQRYLSNQSAISRHTLEDWALAVSGHHGDSITSLMARLHYDIIPDARDPLTSSVFYLVRQQSETGSRVCELNQSQQQIIYQLYSMIAVAELKGYTMLNYAWMLLKIYDKGNFQAEADQLRQLYTERTLTKVNAAREAMADADRSLFKCDPKTWIEGENYVRLTKLLQGYIENEVNLNPDGTCKENCNAYKVTEYHGCYKEQFCAQQDRCHGKVVQCKYVDSDMNICQSSGTDRRYDWIEYENGRSLGNKGVCPNKKLHKVDSWWRYLFWHCSYCFCLCDDNNPAVSDRYFNLREVTSDVANNKVITGVRFVKEKQVIHIQIQQGQLLERGSVNVSSLAWVPVQGYSVLDHDVEEGKDYHAMNWKERSIDLDDIVAPQDHVMTGLRLRMLGTHLNLEVKATPFDFQTGILHPEVKSLWLQNDNTDASLQSPRSEVFLPDVDLPTRRGPNTPNSRHDQFVSFKESSMTLDAAQSTVPFIDSQPIESNGLLVSGVGIYHRGTYNSGGVLALKLMTYDFSQHMISEQPANIA